MAAPRVGGASRVDEVYGSLNGAFRGLDAHRIRESAENLGHLLGCRFGNPDLVGNSPKVRFFEHRPRFQVRAEADRAAERKGDPLPGDQGRCVFPAFEGGDPAVQQLVWRYSLSAEVVDREEPPMRLEVRRSLVVADSGIVGEVEVFGPYHDV